MNSISWTGCAARQKPNLIIVRSQVPGHNALLSTTGALLLLTSFEQVLASYT